MNVHRGQEWSQIVRENWKDTTGFLLALSQPCINIREEELAAIESNCVLVGLDFKDLEAWEPPSSWILGVLLCPNDSTERLAQWTLENDVKAERIHFYLHPQTPWEALRPWDQAGLPTNQADDDIDTWERLHKRFGLALNDQVAKDHGPN